MVSPDGGARCVELDTESGTDELEQYLGAVGDCASLYNEIRVYPLTGEAPVPVDIEELAKRAREARQELIEHETRLRDLQELARIQRKYGLAP
jgi:hypothetical protein